MGQVKIFTYTQMEVTDGPQKGSKFPGPVSYVYWANDRYFREAWGFTGTPLRIILKRRAA